MFKLVYKHMENNKKYENQITAKFDKIHLSSVIFQLIFSWTLIRL